MSTLSSDGLEAILASIGVESPIPQFPTAEIQKCPISIFVSHLAGILAQLTGCEPHLAYDAIQWPNDEGDLVMVLPRLRMKGVNAKDLASELMHQFPASPLYGHPFNDGHTLRFFLTGSTLARVLLPYIIDRGTSYGKDQTSGLRELNAPNGERKAIVVEFSSPNLGQEFDGNHLRSTIIGAYIASIYEGMGWDVRRINFLGDWGKHIGVLAVGWSKFGSDELFRADPLGHLLDVYTKIEELFRSEQEAVKEAAQTSYAEKPAEPISDEKDAFFKRMEDGEPDALALSRRFREVCISKYIDLYARLNIKFDDYSGESEVSPETAAEVETVLKEKGIEKEQDEAWIIDFESHGYRGLGMPKIRHRDGTTSYLLRDIAAVVERSRNYSFDKMIYVVTARQDSHFRQVIGALEMMGHSDLANRLQHVDFGRFQGLSPNKGGSGLLLGDIVDQCQNAAHNFLRTHSEDFHKAQGEDPSEIADALGSIALMTQELSVKRGASFVFDLDNMVSLSPYTGISLQYWLSKISSKLDGVVIPREVLDYVDYSMFDKEEYEIFADVLRLLVQFPGIVKNSFRLLECSHILTFLFRLTDLLSDVWAVDIADQEEEVEDEGGYQVREGNHVENEPVQHLKETESGQRLRKDKSEQRPKDEQLENAEFRENIQVPEHQKDKAEQEDLQEHQATESQTHKLKAEEHQPGEQEQSLQEQHQGEGIQRDEPKPENLDVERRTETEVKEGDLEEVGPKCDESAPDVLEKEVPQEEDAPKEGDSRQEGGTKDDTVHKEDDAAQDMDVSKEDEFAKQNGTPKDDSIPADNDPVGKDDPSNEDAVRKGDDAPKEEYTRLADDEAQQKGALNDGDGSTEKDAPREDIPKEDDRSKNSEAPIEKDGIEKESNENNTPKPHDTSTEDEANEGDIPREEERKENEVSMNHETHDEEGEVHNDKCELREDGLPESDAESQDEDVPGGEQSVKEDYKGKGKQRAEETDDDLQIPYDRIVKFAFYECVRQVLENGMRLAGIVPLQT